MILKHSQTVRPGRAREQVAVKVKVAVHFVALSLLLLILLYPSYDTCTNPQKKSGLCNFTASA
jgi:hypothetical protein